MCLLLHFGKYSHRLSLSPSLYFTPIALKLFDKRDPAQDREARMYEGMCWEMASKALYHIYQKTKPAERQAACDEYVRELKAQLKEEIRDAREAIAAEKPRSAALEVVKHRHRRYVAGHHQMLELMQQGEQAIQAAIEDEVIIFEGHRYDRPARYTIRSINLTAHCRRVNRFEFRKVYGW